MLHARIARVADDPQRRNDTTTLAFARVSVTAGRRLDSCNPGRLQKLITTNHKCVYTIVQYDIALKDLNLRADDRCGTHKPRAAEMRRYLDHLFSLSPAVQVKPTVFLNR